MEYYLLKWLHIISATLLFGTGFGSAFYKWESDRRGNIEAIYQTNKLVVKADWIFTTPTIILQPLSGVLLCYYLGYSLTQNWLISSYVLYALCGLCWLPVVYLQIKMTKLSKQALLEGASLPRAYWKMVRLWTALGMIAFSAMLGIYFLMVIKPSLSF